MVMKRKDALKRLRGLASQVKYHLEKMAANPKTREFPKWKREVRGWLMQMEELLHLIGKKTATEWVDIIAIWKNEMEQTNDQLQ
jgi:hypothetical protein